MAQHRSNYRVLAAATGSFALIAASLGAGCGGGEGVVAPDTAATQLSARDQAAMNRAMSLNSAALTRNVKGERPARAAAQ